MGVRIFPYFSTQLSKTTSRLQLHSTHSKPTTGCTQTQSTRPLKYTNANLGYPGRLYHPRFLFSFSPKRPCRHFRNNQSHLHGNRRSCYRNWYYFRISYSLPGSCGSIRFHVILNTLSKPENITSYIAVDSLDTIKALPTGHILSIQAKPGNSGEKTISAAAIVALGVTLIILILGLVAFRCLRFVFTIFLFLRSARRRKLHKPRHETSSLGWAPEPELNPGKHIRPISALFRNAESKLLSPELRIITSDNDLHHDIESSIHEKKSDSGDCWTLRDEVYILKGEEDANHSSISIEENSAATLVVPSSPPRCATVRMGKPTRVAVEDSGKEKNRYSMKAAW
jgi:hypothetical protein